jgi:hypothetical protein
MAHPGPNRAGLCPDLVDMHNRLNRTIPDGEQFEKVTAIVGARMQTEGAASLDLTFQQIFTWA